MFHLTIEVPTRQGVTLRGLHYAPDSSPAPTVMALTPYGADRFHPDGKLFAARGFHFVSLDTRGRGDSDGQFIPFVYDAADGHDAVEWLADQPWSGGDVVLYGGSYCGFVQWAIAGTRPAGLRAIAPVASVYPGVDFPMQGNVPLPYAVRWLSYVDGRRSNGGPFQDESFWNDAVRDAILANRPLRDLDLASVGKRLQPFQDWLDHPELDEYWDSMVPVALRPQVTIPVLTITGQYDDDQLGALTYHDQHLAAVSPDVARRHQVVIGPWDHAGTRSGARSFGGLTFAESSELDLRSLHADWYNWVLDRGPRPELLTDRVVYFHSGEDRWLSAPDLPAGRSLFHLYPHPSGLLSSSEPPRDFVLELKSDPRNAADDSRAAPPEATYFSDASALNHPTNLIHTTAPFPDPLNISGRPQAHLHLSSDLPDFDLLVGLYRLPADGTTILLGETLLRARYHQSLHHPTPWPQGTPTPVTLTAPFISLRTTPGDRLALVIRTPHRIFAPNFQTTLPTATQSLPTSHPGTIHLHPPTHLALPLPT